MFTIVAQAALALAPAIALAFPAQRPAPDTVASDSIIARYYAAIGGRAALLADTTLRLSGHYEEGDFKAQTTMLWKRPNFRRVTATLPDGYSHVEAFDGSDEWEFSDRFSRPVQHDTGAAERAGRRGAEFDESFVDFRAKGHHVESSGTSVLESRPVNQLRVTLADGWIKEYYFDANTGLLIALRKAMPLHAQGADVVSLSFFRDYRRVGNVLRPFASEERNVATGKLMNTLRWDSIESNVTIRPEAFQPPGSKSDAVLGPPARKVGG